MVDDDDDDDDDDYYACSAFYGAGPAERAGPARAGEWGPPCF